MRFLHYDSPLMQFLSKVADIMLVNALFLFCSLPVFTAGAAMTAANRVTQDILLQTDSNVIRTFFKHFRSGIGQSTAAWLLTLLAAGILIYDSLLVFWYLDGGLAVSCYLFICIISVLVFGISVYVFALLARYSNTLGKHIKNAFLLVLGSLPRTAAAVVLALIPPAVPVFFTAFFIKWMWLWFLLLFGLSFLGISRLLLPVLLKTEENDNDKQQVANRT